MKTTRLFPLPPPAGRGGAPGIRVPKRKQGNAVEVRVNGRTRRVRFEASSHRRMPSPIPSMRVVC